MASVRVDGMSLLYDELLEGELLLWHGKPDSVAFGMQTYPLVIFAIPWTAVIGTITVLGWQNEFFGEFNWDVAMATAVYSLHVAVGVLLWLSPVFSMLVAENTLYAVTDRRAIVLTGRKRLCACSISQACIVRYSLSPTFRGAVNVRYAKILTEDDGNSDGSSWTEQLFFAVADVDGCLAAIDVLKQEEKETTSTPPRPGFMPLSDFSAIVSTDSQRSQLERLLAPDEFVCWSGQPTFETLLRRWTFPIGVCAAIATVSASIGCFAWKEGVAWAVVGTIFPVVVGIAGVLGFIAHAVVTPDRTRYVMTNQRVGIATLFGGRIGVEWFSPGNSSTLRRLDGRNGYGSIVMTVLDENGVRKLRTALWGIADAKAAYRIALDLFGI